MINDADDELLDKLLGNPYHVLRNILPNETVSSYILRRRRHHIENF